MNTPTESEAATMDALCKAMIFKYGRSTAEAAAELAEFFAIVIALKAQHDEDVNPSALLHCAYETIGGMITMAKDRAHECRAKTEEN